MILGVVRSNDRQTRSDWGVTNGIRVDPRGFMGAYGLVEKDTVATGQGRGYVCMTQRVLREGHGIIRMLLTGRMVHICQYWTYGRG
jgi:hypothetical protein